MKMFILYACAKLLKFSAKKGEDYNIKCNNCFNEKLVTPHRENDGVNQDHVEGFSVKREFTSTCIQVNNNSVMNIKIITI
jgi:hypothetical protein